MRFPPFITGKGRRSRADRLFQPGLIACFSQVVE
jgi:hypothetical protein